MPAGDGARAASADARRSSRDRLAAAQSQAAAIDQAWDSSAGAGAVAEAGGDDSGAVVPTDLPMVPMAVDASAVSEVKEGRLKGKAVEYYSSEQHLHNLMLKAAVAENEELLTTLHEIQGEQVSNARSLLAERNRNRAERVRDFDDGYRHPEPTMFSAPDLIDRFGLRLSMEAIGEFGEIRHPQLTPLFAVLEELLTVRIMHARRQAVDTEIVPLYNAHLYAHGTGVHDIVMQLHDLVHTDVFQYIKGELARSGERMRVLLGELEQVEQAREDSLKADDIPTANECHCKSVTLLEKLISAIRDRLNQIMMGSEDSGNYRSKFERFRELANEKLGAARGEKEKLKADLLADLDALAQKGEAAARENEEALHGYSTWHAGSNSKLNANAKKQDDLWEQIQDMVHEIKVLGDQRFTEVNHHLAMTEKEERRKREYAEFSEVYAEHCRRMEELLKNTDSSLRMLDAVDEYYRHGCELVEAKNVEEELRSIRLAELRRYLEFYRKYSLVAGDLIIRRKARLAGLNRLCRNMTVQLQMCAEGLDPNRDLYKDEMKKLSMQRDEVKMLLEELEEKFKDQKADFQPTEDLLEEMGEDFVPPQIEHDEMETGKRNLHLKVTKQLVVAEQDEVDTETTSIRKITTNMKLGKETVERKRESRKKARAAGSPPSRPASAPPGR